MIGERPSPIRARGFAPCARVAVGQPNASDGAALWRIARASSALDLNSSYSYLLWCRDFASTSVVARTDGEPVGFVTGYLRPDAPDTVVVWQVAVDSAQRGRGLALAMLDNLVERVAPGGVRFLEATVTADNSASLRLFASFARIRGVQLHRSELFAASAFPDGHAAEDLYRIGPVTSTDRPPDTTFAGTATSRSRAVRPRSRTTRDGAHR